MHEPSPLPANREVFLDARGDGRALRVTWHSESGVVVFSLWRGRVCAGTFRLPVEDVPTLVEMLRTSLEEAYDEARDSFVEDHGDDARDSFTTERGTRDGARYSFLAGFGTAEGEAG